MYTRASNQAVIIQLSTQKSLGSWLIRWFTWSKFSHVDLVTPDGQLLGARLSGGVCVRKRGYAKFSKTQRFIVYNVPTNFWSWARSQVGKPYDWRAILNFGFRRRNWRDTNAWFCSEYVAWVFEQCGRPLINPDVDVHRITPRDLPLSLLLHDADKSLDETVRDGGYMGLEWPKLL